MDKRQAGLACKEQAGAGPRPWAQRFWRFAAWAVWAGFVAGTLATAVQIFLWWLSGTPVLGTLWRDTQLTAAILTGAESLGAPGIGTPGSGAAGLGGVGPAPLTDVANWQWRVLLLATLVHFTLSTIYAAIAMLFARRQRFGLGPALLAGAAYGLSIYTVNLYGFTLFFPWFDVTRGWVTIIAHAVFGITLAVMGRYPARAGACGKRSGSQRSQKA